MRGKFSPTISERYVDRLWWVRNGGGYGLLADGSQMSENYQHYDHEGYDPFGYAANGRDRAGYSIRDYDGSEDLFSLTAGEWKGVWLSGKSVHEYWTAATEVAAMMEDRFRGLATFHPQDERPVGPHIAIRVIEGGGYGVELTLEDIDGAPRGLDIRFDDGTRIHRCSAWISKKWILILCTQVWINGRFTCWPVRYSLRWVGRFLYPCIIIYCQAWVSRRPLDHLITLLLMRKS